MNKFAQKLPSSVCLPEYNKKARWYHLFWLLIPITGIILFALSVENSNNKL